LTVRGKFLGAPETGLRLVAVLRVVQRFPSHDEAASWYAHPLGRCLKKLLGAFGIARGAGGEAVDVNGSIVEREKGD